MNFWNIFDLMIDLIDLLIMIDLFLSFIHVIRLQNCIYLEKALNKGERSRYLWPLTGHYIGCSASLSHCHAQPKLTIMGIQKVTSKRNAKLGYKGISSTKNIPPVPLEALSDSSKQRTRLKSSQKSVLDFGQKDFSGTNRIKLISALTE